MDDPRLAQYSDTEKREIISQLAAQAKADPDTMVEEKCAMTCRVANSFVRIGHLDLFARRVEMVQAKLEDGKDVKETREYRELEDMLWHACYREYYDEAYAPYFETKDAKAAALALMEGSMNKIADMVAGWVRVGFVQGNFNADNCLVGGRTMDYGPFGFLDVYVSRLIFDVMTLHLDSSTLTKSAYGFLCISSIPCLQNGLGRVIILAL
jgi:uncharacterized protein YdiU (UPF0061 family)